jgi:hypothetical protein
MIRMLSMKLIQRAFAIFPAFMDLFAARKIADSNIVVRSLVAR